MSSWLSICQYLRQEHERDCAVPVFGELAGLSRGAILRTFPQAIEGKVTVAEWEDWLRSLGFDVVRYQPGETFTLPCAHLVERAPDFHHWVYQNERGVFDPDPSFQFMPANDPRMLSLACYSRRILTVSATNREEYRLGHKQ